MNLNEQNPCTSKQKRMVDEQITGRGISNPKVIDAMLEVPRHLFIPEAERPFAYEDYPLSIGHGQTISQPYIVAYMTAAAELTTDDKVLEIGTGCGYQTAVLAEIAKEVYSVEIIKPLAEFAQKTLNELGYKNIFIKQGDGYQGWAEHSPFDAIILTAAPEEIPDALLLQLKVGGRMVAPVGAFFQELYLIKKTAQGPEKKRLLSVRFVPMVKG